MPNEVVQSAFITVDKYGETMYTAACYDVYTPTEEEPITPCYGPIARKALRKHQWLAWIDAIIWAVKERTLLSF